MKTFIKNIVYFLIILFFINLVFYAITYKVYFKDYEKVDLTFDTYLLADSHGTPLKKQIEEHGIYNFSAASESYFDMLIKIKFLIKNTHVKRLIISVDDHNLSPYRENTNNLERSSYYLIKEDYNNTFTGLINGLNKRMVLLNPSIREIIRSYIQSFIITTQKEKEWNSISRERKIYKSNDRFNFQFNFSHSSDSLISSLEEIIELCNKNDIELIGIKFPLTKIYYDTIKNKEFDADKIFFKHDLKTYDFRELYINNDDYFANQDHLNQIGSQHFIKILVATLNL